VPIEKNIRTTVISLIRNVVRCRIITNLEFSVAELFLKNCCFGKYNYRSLLLTTVVRDFNRTPLRNENIHDHWNKSYQLCPQRIWDQHSQYLPRIVYIVHFWDFDIFSLCMALRFRREMTPSSSGYNESIF
jgi:hypothetical protein